MKLAIIQARMGSTRLPGKVLKEVCGKPLLQLQLERVEQASRLDRFMVATTGREADQAIAVLCERIEVRCYRGSEDDVLDRFYQAARLAGCQAGDAIIRLTADCPLLDPEVIDRVICLYDEAQVDYASNVNPPTFPDGLDVEVFSYTALNKAWSTALLKSEREHVTPYIRNHPELFSQANYKGLQDLSALRWTVDEARDLELVTHIYEHFYPRSRVFSLDEILAFLADHPEVAAINQGFARNEGYLKSLAGD